MLERRFRTLRIVATWCVRQPSAFLPSSADEHVAEPVLEIGERANEIALVPEQRIAEVAVDDALANEVDQRIGLRVDVVLVEQHLGVLQHFAQVPT